MKIFALIKVRLMKKIGFLLYFFGCKNHIRNIIQKQGIKIVTDYEQEESKQ